MTDYKDTLNLPQTKFPMKGNLAQREPERLKYWQSIDLYGQLQTQGQTRKSFILHDGPPYANGDIHLGHAVNKVLKDIVVKSKTMSGAHSPFIPGWDCHGLPIEINVEKKVGKVGAKVDAKTFRKKCREYAQTQMEKQREDFQRLGVFGDWQHPYLTMDFKFEADIIRALKQVIGKGHLRQGFKPVHWCFDCQSSLAEAEVEYQDKTSPSIDVRFRIEDNEHCLGLFGYSQPLGLPLSIIIWTTTPWTLPSNRAVALHPQLSYAIVELHDECIIVAKDMVPSILERYGIRHYKILAECQGRELAGINLLHPFYDRTVPVVLGDHVTTDAGTGAVHTAPSHGEDDYRLGREYDLPLDNFVNANGVFNEDTPIFSGAHVFKANEQILDVLKEKGALLNETEVAHSYPHCWRHKTPVIFRATPQWFISMSEGLGQQASDALKDIAWIPKWGQERMAKMLDARPDWCISRQRAWGVPIPLLVHQETQALHPDTDALLEKIATLVEEKGIDAWFDLEVSDLLGSDAGDYRKITDVLDVWFDSGVTHYTVLRARSELDYPADMYLEGSDQYRGWFQTSLLTGIAIEGQAPYKSLLTHGFVVDDKGRKMSKSLGNVIAPETVVKTLGADILRLWVAATDYTVEMSVSDEILKRNSDTYRRIRNTARFLLANLHDFNPSKDSLPNEKLLALDRWIVDAARCVQEQVLACYEHYRFHQMIQTVHHFCSIELGSFYLDIIKDRQYTCRTQSIARRSAQTAMYHIIQALARWIAPILSFTADEIWEHIPGDKPQACVHLMLWYEELSALPEDFDLSNQDWQQFIAVRDAVNKQIESQRNAGAIGSALEADVILYAQDGLHKQLSKLDQELRFVLITSNAQLLPFEKRNGDAANTDIEGLALEVKKLEHPKCARCWHRREDVGAHVEHPALCGRCVNNIDGVGEQRRFA